MNLIGGPDRPKIGASILLAHCVKLAVAQATYSDQRLSLRFWRHSWRPSLPRVFRAGVLSASLETRQVLQQYLSKAWFCVILTRAKFTNV